jgi:hypothetical protein
VLDHLQGERAVSAGFFAGLFSGAPWHSVGPFFNAGHKGLTDL